MTFKEIKKIFDENDMQLEEIGDDFEITVNCSGMNVTISDVPKEDLIHLNQEELSKKLNNLRRYVIRKTFFINN